MSKETEFVGGYIDVRIAKKIEKIAKKEERSKNYVIGKLLALGVRHLRKKTKAA